MKRNHLRTPLLLLALTCLFGSALAQPVLIPDDYRAIQTRQEISTSEVSVQDDHILNLGVFTVDNSNREEVRTFFNAIYWASNYATIDWTGSFTPFPGTGTRTFEEISPLAGDTSDLFKEAVLLRINFYRAMAGIPADIIFVDDLNQAAQMTALIMSGNDNISHFPHLAGFGNYLSADGIQGAADSNLAIGSYGPDSVDGYMQDKGSGNTAVGHRRWLLYPPMIEMGTGDAPGGEIPAEAQAGIPGDSTTVRRANAIHVFSPNNFGTFPDIDFPYVAFPQEGYVPYHIVHPRWSFAIDGANFSAASISMTRDGSPIAAVLEPYDAPGLGSNTLVWVYDGLNANNSHTHAKPDSDVTYSVTIDGIQNAPETSYTYNVIVFDPEAPTSGENTITTLTGPAAPEVGTATEYSVALPDFADLPGNTNVTGIRFRSFTTSSGDFIEGAESGIGDLIVSVFGGYNVIDESFASTGSSAFHLSTGELGTNQTITSPYAYLIGDSSNLSFQSMVRSATDTQIAKVNISLDNGVSWINKFSQPGLTPQGVNGGPDENSFSEKNIDLSAYESRTIHIQFAYDHLGGFAFPGSDSNVGWFVDDINLTGVQSMNSITTSDLITESTSIDFTPSAVGDVSLQAQGMLHDFYEMEWGAVLSVSAVENVTANDDTDSIHEGSTSVSGSVTTNDDKPTGETLAVNQVNGVQGNVGNRIATTYGHITISSNGDYTYELDNTNSEVADLLDGETLEDSVTYRVSDSQNLSDSGTLRVTINGASVSINNDEGAIDEGEGYIKGSITENDNKPDGETLTVTEIDGEANNVGTRIKKAHGYLVIAKDGSFAYQTDPDDPDVANLNDGETLEDTFTYAVQDSQGNTDVGTLRIRIDGETTVESTGNSQVVNISTRSEILTGANVMIAGFTVIGSDPLDVLIVSEGPELSSLLTGAIENPRIELFKTDFTQEGFPSISVDIPQNPNTKWGGSAELSDSMTLLRNRSLPVDSSDAAMRATLTEGVYTLIVSGVDNGTGIGTVEVYDESYQTNPDSDGFLFNIATRSFVGSDQDSAMIAGFTVIGDKPQKVLIRAQGPGIGLPPGTTALANPKIQVLETFPNVEALHENDDWGDEENNMAEILLVAAAVNSQGYVTGSLNSAMVVDLEPNKVYSVILSGGAGESGVALVEVFVPTDL